MASTSTYITGLPGEALRSALWDRYVRLLESGVSSDRILVLLESSTRSAWVELLKGETPAHVAPSLRGGLQAGPGLVGPTGEQRVFTPAAWIQRELERWWPVVEEGLARPGANEPLFVAIDLAQYLMGRFTRPRREQGMLATAEAPLHLQNIQLLDALARGIENGLATSTRSLPEAIAQRLHDGAPDTRTRELATEAGEAMALYIEGMLEHRILDHALALELYSRLLYPDSRYQAHVKASTTHLIVEHFDEASPRLQELIGGMLEGGVTGFLSLKADPDPHARFSFRGGLRQYLGADPEGAWQHIAAMEPSPLTASEPPLADLGRALHDGLMGSPRPAVLPPDGLVMRMGYETFAEMLDAVAADLGGLLADHPPNTLAIVAPSLDPLLIWALRQRLASLGVALYVFAGTNRLSDYRPVRVLLTLAKLCYPWDESPTRFEVMELAEVASGANPLKLGRLPFEDGCLPDADAFSVGDPETEARYAAFVERLESLRRDRPEDLALFFPRAFACVYAPLRSAGLDEGAQREISQIGQLIELASRFRDADERIHDDSLWGPRFLAFLAEQPIAERPFFRREPHRAAVTLSTASQLAEKGPADVAIRHLLILDAGSERWWKPDRKELSNPRVLSSRWRGGAYGYEDEQRDMNEKLARVLFSCCLKPTERLWIYGCLTDAEGRENQGELPYLLGAMT